MTMYRDSEVNNIIDAILWECYQKGIDPRALLQNVLKKCKKGGSVMRIDFWPILQAFFEHDLAMDVVKLFSK